MEGGPRESDFLPPEAPGPEPDLGDPQPPHQGPTQQLPPTDQTQTQPDAHGHAPYGQQPPPQGWPAPQQGWGQQPGWQGQPPGGWHQPGAWQGPPQQQPWPGQAGWQPQTQWARPPQEPDNGPAVAGFSLSMSGGGLLLLSGGLSSILSLGLSIAGWVYSRKGKALVESGRTQKHQGLAQAGLIIGIISTILSVLATLGWGALIAALVASEDFRRELEDGNFGEGNTISWELSIDLARAAVALLS